MAQPSNTFDSYDGSNSIKEDLSGIIESVSPEDTPFFSACKKTKATATLHEYQTDSLRSAAANAHIEGDATAAEARTATTRLGNRTQIFKNAVVVPDTDAGLSKAGKNSEMAYQVVKVAKEQKLDIELALFANNAVVAGSASAARELGGAPIWLTTNDSFASGNSGAAPNGTGGARTDDGTPRDLTQAIFDATMQSIWTAGGQPDTVYLSPYQMNIALGFTGNNNQRSTVQAGDAKVVKSLDVYVTPWGTVEFQPSRLIRGRDILIAQNDMWNVAVLRPTKNVELAKNGDNSTRQVVTELTLVCKNEAASGLIADLAVS